MEARTKRDEELRSMEPRFKKRKRVIEDVKKTTPTITPIKTETNYITPITPPVIFFLEFY